MHPLQLELKQLKSDYESDLINGHADNIGWFKSEIKALEAKINNQYAQDQINLNSAYRALEYSRKSLNTAKSNVADDYVLEVYLDDVYKDAQTYNEASKVLALWSYYGAVYGP